ncbi:ComEC/Rec2 family competence protein [Ferruginibacter sp. SUN002]|uniref:ComEC/Rec2 family competence protein n=1 Tax=Ferruginibacter sp. SUN002 TaxID=2937789 RepID=UPI003D36CE78
MKRLNIPIWKTAPFLRLLLPFIAGILLEWYLQIPLTIICISIVCFTTAYLLFYFLPIGVRFKLQSLQGLLLNLILINFGLFITWQKDIRHTNNWYGQNYHDSDYLVVCINEPIVEKTKSYKADGYIESMIRSDSVIKGKGKLLLYFSKDSSVKQLHYGDKILISKNLQAIKNSGNPGAFNYERYAAFQQTFHNVFLKDKDWVKLKETKVNWFNQFIFSARDKILATLEKTVGANTNELGIAEALLIGYTNDLDKDLVQAYSNTGVVHIIAISGMHLGLIYVMLVWIFARTPLIKKSKITQVVLILSCLWLFSILTGGSASVLRSAVMFSFITVGKTFFRQASIYNSLAASAFVMLCYNPYYLWDVGFQLSYLAVVGIIVFQKPIYNLFYVKNKWIDKVWQLAAVSLAAQILTFPICIYYFHQFPNLFLITNIIAVPLSTIILFAEIGLVALAWVPFVGIYLGKAVAWLVWLMNKIILSVNDIPFAVWDRIPATVFTTWSLYIVVICLAVWLLNKNKQLLEISLFCLLTFTIAQVYGKWQIANQHKLIVYNVPQHQAIDFIEGNNYQFVGDSALLADGMLQNFHLKPGRIQMQLNKQVDSVKNIFTAQDLFYQFGNKKILLIDKSISFEVPQEKINVDIIIISKSPKLYIPQLTNVFNCKQIIFDASNSLWKIEKWKKDCERLHLQNYSVPQQGAFILEL